MRNIWVWIAAVAIITGGILFALMKDPVVKVSQFSGPVDTTVAAGTQDTLQIVPKNAPVVIGFKGDLLLKGNSEDDGQALQPFVVSEVLKLEADAQNAVEYLWKVNGQILKEKDQDWSTQPTRFYDVLKPGKYVFSVQVRGADKAILSLEKQTDLEILPLKILSVEKSIIHGDDDRFVTGEEINLDVIMASAMGADPDFYQFRYFVNDEPIKHPDEDPEDVGDWTHNTSLQYAFPAPGSYTFKVEARRTTEKEPESRLELPETVVVADAVILSLDAFPDHEKGLPVGTLVSFNSFPVSRYGKSESRYGVKKINVADYGWLAEESGGIWGESDRTWIPTEPGTYLVRAEVREIGKELPDDFREMYLTITDGNF